MTTITINGTTLHFLERGLPGAPAVVLLHGFPLDGRMWRAQLDALGDHYRVIVPDHRGFGQSRSTDPFTMESLADDVHALIEQLGASPVVLGGLSMGGYVALAYVRKYSASLRGLMLVDTRAEADSTEGREQRGKMIELARSQGSKAVGEKMMEKLVSPHTLERRPQIVREVRAMTDSCPPLTIEHALEAMRDRPDQTGLLPSIATPTLILVGDADAITPPAVAKGMHAAIPGSECVIVRGAGHMSPMEQPEQVNGAMEKFLAGVVK